MATVKSMVSKVRSMFKINSSDTYISDRAIADELKTTAKELIKRETDKRKLFGTDNIFTELSCIKMKPVPITECCDYKSDCLIARSVEKLPRIGENIYGFLIQGVFSLDNKTKFNYMDPNRYVGILKLYPNKVNDMKVFWLKNGYLYANDSMLEDLNMFAFLEDDYDKLKHSCGCESEECPDNPLDLEFKCPGYLEPAVLRIVRDTMLKTYKNSAEDTHEDDKDSSK